MSEPQTNRDNELENASEEVQVTGEGQPDTTNTTERDTATDLVDEIREFGNQVEAAFRAALESERTRQLQRDLMGGLKELSSQLKTVVKSAQENPRVLQASERGKEVLRNAQHSKTAQDLQETLVSGITQLNVQLRKLVDRLETGEQDATMTTTTTTTTQHIPVEHSNTPAEGATVRLDNDPTTPDDTTKY